MNKTLIILSLVLLASCGPSAEEKRQVEMEQQRIEMEQQRIEQEASEKLAQEKAIRIAAVTCSIMGETRNMDAAIRVREMNDAREKIGGEPFLRGDSAIQEAFEWGLCQELVLNESYDETLQPLKDANRERERIAAEKRAEENRIAAEKQRIVDSKPTVKEWFHLNGKLKSRINYQSKSDGGEIDGLQEWYHDNGQLHYKTNYKDGKREGLYERYYDNGELEHKGNYKDGKEHGLQEWYLENGKLMFKSCYVNGEKTDMSYCEK
jgi:hypothetical protein